MGDDDKTTSRTEEETFIEERLTGSDPHFKTTIRRGNKKVEGRAGTSEESQEIASDKWDKVKSKDQ